MIDELRSSVSRFREHAFTRVELTAVIAGISLLGLVLLPAFANSDAGSERAVCFNNLRLIGKAVHSWVGDSPSQKPAWWTPVAEGGTVIVPKPGNAWYEFVSYSNYASPRILACPSDKGVKPARDWSEFVMLRQGALSYTLGPHAGREGSPENTWLSSDFNLRRDPGVSGCSSGMANVHLFNLAPSSALAWTNAVHVNSGHVLLYNGAVEFTATPRLRELLLQPANDDAGAIHFLRAR
jgi:hypothetical protein